MFFAFCRFPTVERAYGKDNSQEKEKEEKKLNNF